MDAVATQKKVVNLMSDAASADGVRDRRWVILGVIGLAQLMVILDLTVMNIALLSAQRTLHFTTVDRQWVVTAYTRSATLPRLSRSGIRPGRAIRRANVDRLQATASHARPLFRLVKCPVGPAGRRPAMAGP